MLWYSANGRQLTRIEQCTCPRGTAGENCTMQLTLKLPGLQSIAARALPRIGAQFYRDLSYLAQQGIL